MLPYFFRYEHVNYARWGTVYLAEMSTLPPEVLFGVSGRQLRSETNRTTLQAGLSRPKHRMATWTKSGDLVGITRITSALNRWTLSYNLRTVITSQTTAMMDLSADDDDDYTHNECTKRRMENDDSDEQKLVQSMKNHGVLHDSDATLKNIINKDMVTPEIQESLLAAESLGLSPMRTFVDKRLCQPPDSDMHLDLKAPIQKIKAKTFASLYEVVKVSKGKQNTIKVERNILQRLITAYRAGRDVNLENILQHELMTIPFPLATTDGSLHSTNKSVLANILTQQVENISKCRSRWRQLFAHWWPSTFDGTWKASEYNDVWWLCKHLHRNCVQVRDTDVLLLLLAHYSLIDCTRLYVKAGTSKAPKYFPVHEIHQNLSVE